MRGIVVWSAVALLAAVLARPAFPIAPGEVTPSTTCGSCHRDIYRMWRTSAHASSVESLVFLSAYGDTVLHEGMAVARVCLGCHAPLFEITRDPELKLKVTSEGVSCDACHSLVSVELSTTGAKQVFDPGPVKRGPIRDAASTAHEVAYSELHTSALVCAGCHEFRNAEGTPIITTYSEWEASEAARQGATCQSCHMALTRANVVDPKTVRVTRSDVNLHQTPGGHSLQQLHKALAVVMRPVRDAGGLAMEVRITNKGAGHAVPTGMPGRRVILAVEVRTGDGKTFGERRVYTKSFVGADGGPVVQDRGFFGRGIRVDADSRIKPDEERVETFRFPVPAEATAQVRLKLHYEHTPTGGPEDRTWLTFYAEERMLAPEPPGR